MRFFSLPPDSKYRPPPPRDRKAKLPSLLARGPYLPSPSPFCFVPPHLYGCRTWVHTRQALSLDGVQIVRTALAAAAATSGSSSLKRAVQQVTRHLTCGSVTEDPFVAMDKQEQPTWTRSKWFIQHASWQLHDDKTLPSNNTSISIASPVLPVLSKSPDDGDYGASMRMYRTAIYFKNRRNAHTKLSGQLSTSHAKQGHEHKEGNTCTGNHRRLPGIAL